MSEESKMLRFLFENEFTPESDSRAGWYDRNNVRLVEYSEEGVFYKIIVFDDAEKKIFHSAISFGSMTPVDVVIETLESVLRHCEEREPQ